VNEEKATANTAINNPAITVGGVTAWSEYLIALDAVCLCPDFDCDPKFPPRPDV